MCIFLILISFTYCFSYQRIEFHKPLKIPCGSNLRFYIFFVAFSLVSKKYVEINKIEEKTHLTWCQVIPLVTCPDESCGLQPRVDPKTLAPSIVSKSRDKHHPIIPKNKGVHNLY